jgi:hypothetical protein
LPPTREPLMTSTAISKTAKTPTANECADQWRGYRGTHLHCQSVTQRCYATRRRRKRLRRRLSPAPRQVQQRHDVNHD